MFLPALIDDSIVGGQLYPIQHINYKLGKGAKPNERLGKYLWISSAKCGGVGSHNYDTGEFPMFLRVPPHLGKAEGAQQLNVLEGALKSALFAFTLWPTTAEPVVGASGGQFSTGEITRLLRQFSQLSRIVLWPDAGASQDRFVIARYRNLKNLVDQISMGKIEVFVAWWGQTDKSAPDPDELSVDDVLQVMRLPWAESEFAQGETPPMQELPPPQLEQVFLAAYLKLQLPSHNDLAPEDFESKNCQAIWSVIKRDELMGVSPTIESVAAHLDFDKLGEPRKLVEDLKDLAVDPQNLDSYGATLALLSGRRKLIRAAGALADGAADGSKNLSELCTKAIEKLQQISAIGAKPSPIRLSDAVMFALTDLSARQELPEASSISTGYPNLDRKLNGFRSGELIIVGARPGAGKSTLALNLGMNAAQAGHCTLFISLEMTVMNLAQKVLSKESRVWYRGIADGQNLEEAHWEALYSTVPKTDIDFYLDTTAIKSVADAEKVLKATQLASGNKVEMLIVDYLQLISMDAVRGDNMNYAVGKITREFKSLALRLGIPIILLSQLSRGVESRNDKRPVLSDLRDSGSIEQDADKVLLLYRDDYYTKGESLKPGVVEVDVAKNRNGETGVTNLHFKAQISSFSATGY
jgi:replicative DNA helicase